MSSQQLSNPSPYSDEGPECADNGGQDNHTAFTTNSDAAAANTTTTTNAPPNGTTGEGVGGEEETGDRRHSLPHLSSPSIGPSPASSATGLPAPAPAPATANWTANAFNSNTSTTAAPAPAAAQRTQSGPGRNRSLPPPSYALSVKSPLSVSTEPDDLPSMSKNDACNLLGACESLTRSGGRQHSVESSIVLSPSGFAQPPPPHQHQLSSSGNTPNNATSLVPSPPHAAQAGATGGGAPAPPSYEVTLLSRSASGTFHQPTPALTSMTNSVQNTPPIASSGIVSPPPGGLNGNNVLGGSLNSGSGPPPMAGGAPAPPPPSYAQYQRLSVHQSNSQSNSGSGTNLQQATKVTSQDSSATGTPKHTSSRFQSISGPSGMTLPPARQSLSPDNQYPSPVTSPPPASAPIPYDSSAGGTHNPPLFTMVNTSQNRPRSMSNDAAAGAYVNTSLGSPTLDPSASNTGLRSPHHSSSQPGGGGTANNTSISVRVGGGATPTTTPSGSFRIPPNHDMRPAAVQGSVSNSSFSGRQESHSSVSIKVGGIMLPPTPTRAGSGAGLPSSTFNILSQREREEDEELESFDDEEHGHIGRRHADLPPPMSGSAPTHHHRQGSLSNNNSFAGGGGGGNSFGGKPPVAGTPLSQYQPHPQPQSQQQQQQQQSSSTHGPPPPSVVAPPAAAVLNRSNNGSFSSGPINQQWRGGDGQQQQQPQYPPHQHQQGQQPPMPNQHSSSPHFPTGGADGNNYGQNQRGGGGGGQPPFNNSFGRPSLPPQSPLVGVPVPQLCVSLSTTQMDPPRVDGGSGAMMAPTTTSSMIQRQCASLRVTRLQEEEGARIRYIDTDHMPPPNNTNLNNATPAVDSNTLIGFLTNKELVHTFTSVSDFIASSTVPVKANFNEYPTETQHQRIDRILNQPILTSSSRPNSPSAPPSPVPVAVDGHYLLTKVRAMMMDHDPCWMLIHPCPPLLLHMLKAEIRTLRQRGIEPIVVFDGLSFSADVQESLVDCRDSLRAASTVWSQLHSRSNNPAASTATFDAVAPTPTSPGAAPTTPTAAASSNAEENRRLLKVVKESTWVSEEAQDITGIVFRYLVSELKVNAMFAPYSSWAQLGLMFSEGTVVAVMGPPELLAIEAPSLKVIASVTSKEIRVLDKSKILDGLFGTSSVPGPIHEFCDRYNTEIILPFQQHHQRQQQEVHIREQREHSLGGSMGGGASSHPPSPFSFSAVTAATSNGTTGSIRSTPLPPPPPVSSYPDNSNRAPSSASSPPGPDALFPFGVPPSITPMTPIRVASNLFQMLVLCKSPHPRLRYLRPSFLPPHYSGGWECLYRELSMNRALPNTTRSDIPPPPLYNSFLDLLRDREIPVEIRDIVKRKFEAREFPSGTLPVDAERAELDEQLVRGVHCAKLGLLFLTKTPGYSTLATEHRSQLFGYVQALIDDVSHNSDTGAWRGATSGVGAGGGGSSAAEWCQQRGAVMLVAPTASLAMQNAMNRHHRPLLHCCEVERVELLETGGKAVDPALGIDCMGPHSSIPLDCAPYRLPSGQVHHTQLVLGSVPAGLPKVLKQRLPAIANYLLSVGLINPALLDTAASKHPMITTHTPLSDTLELRDKMKMMLLIQGQVVGFLAGVFGTTLTKSPEWVRWFVGGRGSGGTTADGQTGAGSDAESSSLKETLFDTQGSLSDVIPTLRHWSLHDLLPTRASGTRVVARQSPSDPLCIVHADLALPHETAPVTFEDALLVVIAKGHAIRFVELTSLSVGVSSTSPNPAGTRGQHTNYQQQQQPVASTTITEEYGWEVYAPCLGTVPPPILTSSPSTETITDGSITYIRAAPAASPTMTRPHSHAETNAQHLEHNGIAQITASSMLMSLEFLGYIDVNPRDCCKVRDQSSNGKRGSGHHNTPAIRTGNASRFTRVFDGLRAGALRPLDVVRVLLTHDIVPIQFSPDAAITGLSDLGCTLLRAIRTAPIHLLPPVLRVPHTASASATSSPQPTPLGASNSALPDDTQHLRHTYSHLFTPIADSDQGLLVTLIELLRTGFLDDQPFNYTHYIVTEYKEDSSSSQSPTWDSSTEPGRLEGRHIDSSRDATWFESSDMHGGLEDAAVALLSRIACLVPVQMHPTASWDANYDRRLTTFAQMAGVVQQTLRGLSEAMAVRAVVGNTTLVTPTPGSGPSSSATSRADKPLSPACGVELSECAGLPFALPFAEVPSPIGGLLLKDFLTAVPPCQQLNRLVAAIAEHPRPAHPLTTQEEKELTQRLAGASAVGAEVTVSTGKATSSATASKAAASSPSLTINTNASFNNQCSISSSQPSSSLISIASSGGALHMESHDGRTRSPLAINAVNLASGWLAAEHQVSWVEQKYEGILNVREELTRILSFTRVALWIILELNGGAAGSDSTSSSNKKSSSLRKTVIRARELLDHQEGLWASLKKAALDASLSPSGSPPQQSLNQQQSSDNNNNNNNHQQQQPPPRPYRHNPYQQYAQPTSPLGGEGGGGGGRGGGGPGQQQRPRRGRGGGNAQ